MFGVMVTMVTAHLTLIIVCHHNSAQLSMEKRDNVKQGKNLVCPHRNMISKEIQNKLKAKVSYLWKKENI